MNKSDDIKNLVISLCKAKSEFPEFQKTASVNYGKTKFDYAPIEEIVNKVNPVLSKHELIFTQSIENDDKGDYIETTIFHSTGQWISTKTPFLVPANGQEAKNLGSTMTYLKRYSLVMTLGIAPEDDKDHIPLEGQQQNRRGSNQNPIEKAKKDLDFLDREKVYQEKKAVFNKVIDSFGYLIDGISDDQKNAYFQNILKVKKSDELKFKSLEELKGILIQIQEEMKRNGKSL